MSLDDALLTRLRALNAGAEGLLDPQEVDRILLSQAVPESIGRKLGASARGRVLRRRVETALEGHRLRRRRVFLAHSFHSRDAALVLALRRALRDRDLTLISGKKRAAGSVARKVLGRIESCAVFVALLTEMPQQARPSPWIISELGFAARMPRVILLERGIHKSEIGGIHADVEHIRFSRDAFMSAFEGAAAVAARRVPTQ